MVHFLLAGKKTPQYRTAWRFLKTELPDLPVTSVMSDFESAIGNAAVQIYNCDDDEEVRIILEKCYFHYTQVLIQLNIYAK